MIPLGQICYFLQVIKTPLDIYGSYVIRARLDIFFSSVHSTVRTMWRPLFPLWLILAFSSGRVFEGPCPKNLPLFNIFPDVFELSVLYYLPVDSKVNHMFYPNEDHRIANLRVGIQFFGPHLFLYKVMNGNLKCETELAEMTKKGFLENHEILSNGISKRVNKCGPEWQMYQIFRQGIFYILWGCRDLQSEDRHEQGAWILGDTNITGNMDLRLPTELIEAIQFSQIQIMDFKRPLPSNQTTVDQPIDQICANYCKYYSEVKSMEQYIAYIIVPLTLLAVVKAWQLMFKSSSTRVFNLRDC